MTNEHDHRLEGDAPVLGTSTEIDDLEARGDNERLLKAIREEEAHGINKEQLEINRRQAEINEKLLKIGHRNLRVQSFSALVSAITLIGLLTWNAYQVYEAGRSAEETSQNFKSAAEFYATNSAAARPYFAVEVAMEPSKKNKNLFIPHVSIMNDGHTPALLVTRLESGFSPVEIVNPEDLKFERLSISHPDHDQSLVRIGPHGDQVDLPYHADLDVNNNQPIRDANEISRRLKKEYFYVWGGVLYEDVLQSKHLIRFCYSHFPDDPAFFISTCNFLNDVGVDLPKNTVYVMPTAGAPIITPSK